jgi:hypothetical protein
MSMHRDHRGQSESTIGTGAISEEASSLYGANIRAQLTLDETSAVVQTGWLMDHVPETFCTDTLYFLHVLLVRILG